MSHEWPTPCAWGWVCCLGKGLGGTLQHLLLKSNRKSMWTITKRWVFTHSRSLPLDPPVEHRIYYKELLGFYFALVC